MAVLARGSPNGAHAELPLALLCLGARVPRRQHSREPGARKAPDGRLKALPLSFPLHACCLAVLLPRMQRG